MRTILFQSISLVLLLASIPPVSDAQWVQTNGPSDLTNSIVYSLGVSETNLFAGTYPDGVFLSTNMGTSWTVVNTGLTNGYVFAFAMSGVNLFAGASDGVVLRSTNNGVTWTTVSAGLPTDKIAALAVSGTNLFEGGDGVYLSTNDGANWTEADAGLTNLGVLSLAVNGINIFAGTEAGVFLSTNNGATWEAAGLPTDGVGSLAMSESNLFAGTSSGVFLSSDSGASWTAADSGLTDTYVVALAVSGTNLFVATVRGGVFLSTNSGISWTALNDGLGNARVYNLAVSGTNIFAGTEGFGVWRRPLSEALPIQLVSIAATQISSNRVRLNWKTLSETNNYGFEVQKAKSPPNYESIPNVFVSGQGTTLSPHAYSWVDSSAQPGDFYRLKQTDLDCVVHYSEGIQAGSNFSLTPQRTHPGQFQLEQNYPNPFNPSTTIRFALPSHSILTLSVYNTLGQEVATLVQGDQEAGYHEVRFDGSNLGSGVYFYRIQAGSFVQTKKLLLLR